MILSIVVLIKYLYKEKEVKIKVKEMIRTLKNIVKIILILKSFLKN